MEGKKPQTVAGTAIMMVLKYSSVSSVGIEQVAEKVDIKVGTIQETLRQNMCLVEHVLPDFWQN
jgi:transcription initiation factor TFIIIB Brf1 subunit/transcription initiation factor TFIIB